jgi:hypothetical protein
MHISMVAIPKSLPQIKDPGIGPMIDEAATIVLAQEAGIVTRMFLRTTRTWNHQVDFDTKLTERNGDFVLEVWTNDMIYYFVDKGTSVRYATMTYDPLYIPKTSYRKISSRRGEGGLLYINPNDPKPGIEAREFTLEIARRREPYFERKMAKAIDKATKRYFDKLLGA